VRRPLRSGDVEAPNTTAAWACSRAAMRASGVLAIVAGIEEEEEAWEGVIIAPYLRPPRTAILLALLGVEGLATAPGALGVREDSTNAAFEPLDMFCA